MSAPVERLPGTLPPKIGRYALCFEIAHGGMATVYLARAQGSDGFERAVALKCIHRHLASEPGFVEMFLDEARIASSIHHPNVCSVFDYGKAEGTYFMAMEYLLGEPLAKLLRELGQRPRERESQGFLPIVARIVADACEGLHAAHEARGPTGQPLDIVHRDVSPQNLFLTYAGVTKVVDFGIARARERVHQTVTGQVKGKFAYMSPEQLVNEEVDRRSDIWAAGVVLWELIVGRSLFKRDTEPATIDAVLHGTLSPPSAHLPWVPRDIDVILGRALARDPKARYATAREMARDLGRFIARSGVPAGSPELSDWMQRLFPKGRAEKEGLIRAAVQMSTGAGVIAAIDSNPSMPAAGVTQPSIDAPTIVRRRKRRASLWLGAGAVAVFTVAVGAGYLAGTVQHDDAAAETETGSETPTGTETETPTETDTETGSVTATDTDTATDTATDTETATATETETDTDTATATDVASETETETDTAPASETDTPADPTTSTDSTHTPDTATSRPRPRPRPRPLARAGTLVLVTPGGWANVYDEEGRLLGQTPLRVSLPSGRHRLSLRPFGQPPAQARVVTIPPGGTARVTQALPAP